VVVPGAHRHLHISIRRDTIYTILYKRPTCGTDDARAEDFNAMIRNKEVKAIFCIRGGYGTPRILPMIDYAAIRKNPKIIVGYSDITALQMAIFKKTGLVSFSGPMSGVEKWKGMDPNTEEQFWRQITSKTKIGILKNPPEESVVVHKHGKARGLLLGGNLSLVVCLLGTPYMPDLKKAILVFEDVDEEPHRLDRMWRTVEQAGILKNANALILGLFTDCAPIDKTTPHLTSEQVMAEVQNASPIPTISNFRYGHIPRKTTIPFGTKVLVDTKKGIIEVLESGVV
jgi:muramoyltetrapeptide carboxypeptidase